MHKYITFGSIRDAGYSKAEVIRRLNEVVPISQPTFDKRLDDGQWIIQHVDVLKNMELWNEL